jgi:hypothetical protein
MALAPWAAECSWGGFTAVGFVSVVVFLGPLYGGAAVLIRETARRTGGGWPVIVLLAAAFGVLQAGLVDQSMFNPDYLSDTQFADQGAAAQATLVPVLGFSGGQAFSFVSTHVALSICAPIAIVESFVQPGRRLEAWLRGPALAVVGVVYVLGSLLIFADEFGRKKLIASPLQLAVAVLVVLALVGVAMLPRRRRESRRAGRSAPRPMWAGLVALGAHLSADLVPGWAGVAIHVAAISIAAAVIMAWSRRTGWGQPHVLAAWAAGLLVAAAGAYSVPNYEPASPTAALTGDIAISVITLALVGGAYWRLRQQGVRPHDAAVHASCNG